MTGRRPLAHPVGQARRRTSPVRRRSAGLTPARAGGLLLMLVAGLAIYGLASSPVFGLERLRVDGAVLTDESAIRSVAAVSAGTNLVTLETETVTAAVERLPTVRRAEVAIGLPGTLDIRVEERTPILVWTVGDRRFLVDVDGRIIDELAADAPIPAAPPSEGPASNPTDAASTPTTGATAPVTPAASTSATVPLPIVIDHRATAAVLSVGATLDPVDLDAARRLASLRPADVGSAASTLQVSVDDADGFIVQPVGGDWTAVFGFYTPSLRTTDLIPGQVRLLRSLLAGRESEVARVVLASATDGTYVPKPSPKASAKP